MATRATALSVGATSVKLIGLYSPYPQMGKGTFADELLTVSAPAATVSFADAMRNVVVDFVSDFFPGGEQEVWAWLSDERKDRKFVPVLGVTLRHMLQTHRSRVGPPVDPP
jgi:hypothetical protein